MANKIGLEACYEANVEKIRNAFKFKRNINNRTKVIFAALDFETAKGDCKQAIVVTRINNNGLPHYSQLQ